MLQVIQIIFNERNDGEWYQNSEYGGLILLQSSS